NLFKSHGVKTVQLLSLILYAFNLFFLSKCLKKIVMNRWFHFAIVTFFALVPVHLHYAYMIMNYVLSTCLASLFFYLLVRSSGKTDLGPSDYLGCGLCVVAGIMTSLSSAVFFPVGFMYFALYPRIAFKKKIFGLICFFSGVITLLYPYYQIRTKVFGQFFMTAHREPLDVKWTNYHKIYPIEFYTHYDLGAFKESYLGDDWRERPVKQRHLRQGLWPMLHQTLYSDYFNYQVDSKTSQETRDAGGLIHTGLHYLTKEKARQFTVLDYLGIPISVLFLFVIFKWLWNAVLFLVFRSKDHFLDMICLSTAALIFFQFMVYILQYPNYVNISAGYLFPGIFLLCLGLAKFLKGTWVSRAVAVYLFVYAAFSYYVFYKRC
ncbi:MAG: hypothetical protein WCG06_02370, partial [Candidatus Omnitrophota bacterium]